MDVVNRILNIKGIKRIIIFSLIILVLYAVKSMISFILFTFIFSFLINRLVTIVSDRVPLNRRIIVIISYLGIVGLLVYGISKYSPLIISEITELIRQVTRFYTKPQDNVVLNFLVDYIETNQITSYLEQGFTFLVKYFTDISTLAIQILLALVLSFFFLLEKPKLIEFTSQFKTSKLAAFYNEIAFFGQKFVLTFGKVIEAQFVIALVNCILTTLALWILGFPQLFGLAIMIFFLGLIPVAGVIISFFPLCTIAYTIGGFAYVLYIVVVVLVIHAIEAYILNPKLMSSKTDLPVFYTFIILIFSEHFFGVWGLIIGIPIFVFLLDVLEVTGKRKSKV
ncbi:AI-2E family transporter [Bacillus sp. 03113]|uniref:AI-2E family transporter n=1 Tax=Bacillus sp. 03113 TaxID=2578211 RepID=UPI00114290CF|nr:AI-2E family transporter [Bacillus sp. 03113]